MLRSKDQEKKSHRNTPETEIREVKTRLTYYRFTRRMYSIIRHHNIRGATRDVFDFLNFHTNYKNNKLDPLSIEFIADEVGIKPRTVYAALAKLEKVGLFHPRQWGTISGYMPETQFASATIKENKEKNDHINFYKALNKRIEAKARARTTPMPERMIENLYLALCRECKENHKFYPLLEGAITSEAIQKEIDRYLGYV